MSKRKLTLKERFFQRFFNITINTDSSGGTSLKKWRRGAKTVNLTFPVAVNAELTKALYYNRVSGCKLGAHFARNIINIPLAFMGFPHFFPEKKVQNFWVDVFTHYNDKMIKTKQDIQRTAGRDGTTWVFPRFDVSTNWVEWDFLPQASEFFYNPITEKLTGVSFEESITLTDSSGDIKTALKKRKYTRELITTDIDGEITIQINTTGELPINFINNGEPEEPEGSSDIEVSFPRIKLYSQIAQKKNEVLLNHDPKLIQYVQNVSNWLKQNQIDDLSTVDLQGMDLVFNLYDKEKTEYLIPTEIIESYDLAQKRNFQNIVEGSEIPEIAWGLKTEGNHASAEEQIAIFTSFISMKRNFYKGAYERLINITFRIMGEANFKRFNFEIDQVWNDLDMLTEVEKSTLFNNYAAGMQKLKSAGAWGKESTHLLLKSVMGEKVIEEYEKFVADIEADQEEPEPAPIEEGEESGAE